MANTFSKCVQYINMIKQQIVTPLKNPLEEFKTKQPRWFSETTEALTITATGNTGSGDLNYVCF